MVALGRSELRKVCRCIGILLYSSINQFMWQEVAVILTAVLGVVVISEFISATVRGRIS